MTLEMLEHLACLKLTDRDQLEDMMAHPGRLPQGESVWERPAVGLAELRPDHPLPSLERAELLACAPVQDGACYLVPRTVGGGQT